MRRIAAAVALLTFTTNVHHAAPEELERAIPEVHLMGRSVKFLPDGKRHLVTPQQLVKLWKLYTVAVPPQYAIGSADHETGFTENEADTEEDGTTTFGVYQCTEEEARRVGFALAADVKDNGLERVDLLTAEGCTRVFVRLAERHLIDILTAANLKDVPMQQLPPDVWSYLFLGHNQGMGRFAPASKRHAGEKAGALGSIADHGLDWNAYKQRNAEEARQALASAQDDEAKAKARARWEWWQKTFAYGDDVQTGGAHWSDSLLQ